MIIGRYRVRAGEQADNGKVNECMHVRINLHNVNEHPISYGPMHIEQMQGTMHIPFEGYDLALLLDVDRPTI